MSLPDPSHRHATPHLRVQGAVTQLIVDGGPFLVLGGELHNSSASSLAYMRPVWPRLAALGLNTVLATVSWEQVEPEEGAFDFALVDGLLEEARAHGLRLVLLWFGSWKNGVSSYAPPWVKRDATRFPRARLADGRAVEVLSTLSEAAREADARAFAALMRHLRAADGERHTVIMVQVENEVGLLGDSRDRSHEANAAFAAPVPPELLAHLREHTDALDPALRARWEAAGGRDAGSWEEVFGAGTATDELFMAWCYACYIEAVAAAGKAEYDLPLFVNAWLNAEVPLPGVPAGGPQPGHYPSGGPLPHVLDIWRAGAPSLDMLAPDIYFGDYEEWCQRYTRRGNPLFVPEMRRDAEGVRNVFMAFAEYGAIGVSPFAIDSLEPADDGPLRACYALLRQVAPIVLAHQGMGTITGFRLDAVQPRVVRELGGYELEITLAHGFGFQIEQGYGLVVATGPGMFLGAGFGFQVAFRPLTAGPAQAGILAVDEGTLEDGRWSAARRLNGDETFGGTRWRFPAPGPSAGLIPILGAGTGLSRCELYRYE
ncbi:MAG: hypothetical protein RLZZ387_2353 [Chloroflexota bacterium]